MTPGFPASAPALGQLNNGAVWHDTDGGPIQAHGGGLLRHEGWWYWYGENKDGQTYEHRRRDGGAVARVDFCGVAAYRSRDLLAWEPLGNVLAPRTDEPHHCLHPSWVVERPKVVFHGGSGSFVMWFHADTADYDLAAAGIALADRPDGPFRLLGATRPFGRDCRDQTVFIDDDGAGYHLCSTDQNRTLLLSRLTDDYRGFEGEHRVVFEGRHMEAHALARHRGRYWYLASGCTGWAPNPARAAVADDLWGEWRELGNPCVGPGADRTFACQSTFLQPLPDGRLLAMFDRWDPRNLADSRYFWLEASIDERGLSVPWRAEWRGLSTS